MSLITLHLHVCRGVDREIYKEGDKKCRFSDKNIIYDRQAIAGGTRGIPFKRKIWHDFASQ